MVVNLHSFHVVSEHFDRNLRYVFRELEVSPGHQAMEGHIVLLGRIELISIQVLQETTTENETEVQLLGLFYTDRLKKR